MSYRANYVFSKNIGSGVWVTNVPESVEQVHPDWNIQVIDSQESMQIFVLSPGI